MASITKRERKDGTHSWRVMWRERGKQQSETFDTADAARTFRGHVDAAGQRWPDGWVPGVGFTGRHSDDTLTVRAWAERAIAARTGIEERTREDYRKQMARHVYPVLGDDLLKDVTPERIGLWLNGLDVAPKTSKNLHGTLSSIFSDAVGNDIIRRNPCEGIKLDRDDRPEDGEPVFLAVGEFFQLVDALPEQWRPLVLLLGGTGLRWSEATALQVRDVDLVTNTLRVARAWKRQPDGSQKVSTTKTRSSVRTVSFAPAVADILLSACVGKRGADLVFTAPEGGEVRHSAFYNRVWARAVDKVVACEPHTEQQRNNAERVTAYWHPSPCGCPGFLEARPRVHDLRHSCASWALNQGQPLMVVSRALGHRDIRTTANVYGHLEKSALSGMAASIEAEWSQVRRSPGTSAGIVERSTVSG